MRKYLVTGGGGFIGSNLVDRLLSMGHEVVCLDNFSTGRRENLEDALLRPNFQLIEGDIRNLKTCDAACVGVDVVLHQAALGSVPRSISDPATTNAVNIEGTLNMLIACRDNGIQRFVYAASSSTYGDSEILPKREDLIGKPLSPYAITKYVNELYAENFARIYGLETIGLRYFNVFGRGQTPDGAYAAVVPRFAKSLIRHSPLTINGDGTFSRDFTYIENVLQANMLAAETVSSLAINQVYNIACGTRTSLNELVAVLKKCLATYDPAIADVKVIHGPCRMGDIPHSLAEISKAKSLLGYDPSHTFEQGIKEAANWYYQHLA